MNMEDTIYKRQSCRDYEDKELDEKILMDMEDFIQKTKKLNKNIDYYYEIVTKDKIKTILPWKAPHYLLLFSEEKENYKENIGFIFQQLDLYLQSKGIGTCWLGMVSPNKKYNKKDEKYSYIIAISLGYPKNQLYRKKEEFKRKKLEEISDKRDEKLIPAQYAPSAVNSQPWYFTHDENGTINIYREKLGIIKKRTIGKWNPVDIGIALAHIYITNTQTFKFHIKKEYDEIKNKIYIGSFEI